MLKFEIGKSYTHGWIGDSNLFTTWTVLRRTAQTITITMVRKQKPAKSSSSFQLGKMQNVFIPSVNIQCVQH